MMETKNQTFCLTNRGELIDGDYTHIDIRTRTEAISVRLSLFEGSVPMRLFIRQQLDISEKELVKIFDYAKTYTGKFQGTKKFPHEYKVEKDSGLIHEWLDFVSGRSIYGEYLNNEEAMNKLRAGSIDEKKLYYRAKDIEELIDNEFKIGVALPAPYVNNVDIEPGRKEGQPLVKREEKMEDDDIFEWKMEKIGKDMVPRGYCKFCKLKRGVIRGGDSYKNHLKSAGHKKRANVR